MMFTSDPSAEIVIWINIHVFWAQTALLLTKTASTALAVADQGGEEEASDGFNTDSCELQSKHKAKPAPRQQRGWKSAFHGACTCITSHSGHLQVHACRAFLSLYLCFNLSLIHLCWALCNRCFSQVFPLSDGFDFVFEPDDGLLHSHHHHHHHHLLFGPRAQSSSRHETAVALITFEPPKTGCKKS